MGNKGVAALGFALIVVFGVIIIPAAIDRTDATDVQTERIEIGDTAFFNHQIDISNIDSGNNEATLQVTDSETSESQRVVIAENETTNLEFSGGTLEVTNDVSNNQAATITLRYPANYGYSPAANRIAERLPIILVTMLLIAIMAFVGIKP